jgi:hypothetical protein
VCSNAIGGGADGGNGLPQGFLMHRDSLPSFLQQRCCTSSQYGNSFYKSFYKAVSTFGRSATVAVGRKDGRKVHCLEMPS